KFSLFVFGGAGALHGAAVARSMGMKEVIISPLAGLFSAYGLLCADIQRIYVHAFDAMLENNVVPGANEVLRKMTKQALKTAYDHGYSPGAIQLHTYADLRYRRQQSELTLPLPNGELVDKDLASLEDAFHKEYENTFGFRLSNTPLEVVNLRVSATIPIAKPDVPRAVRKASSLTGSPGRTRKAFFGDQHGVLNVSVCGLDEINAEGTPG